MEKRMEKRMTWTEMNERNVKEGEGRKGKVPSPVEVFLVTFIT